MLLSNGWLQQMFYSIAQSSQNFHWEMTIQPSYKKPASSYGHAARNLFTVFFNFSIPQSLVV